jgi:competence protein ComEC
MPAVGAWGSAALCTLLEPAASVTTAAVAGLAALVAARRHGVIALLAVGVALGAASAAWHVHGLRHGIVASMAAAHADADVVVRLVRDPVAITTASGASLTLIDATVTRVFADRPRDADSPVLVMTYGSGWDGLLPGQHVEVTGKLSPPRRGDDVAAVLAARSPPTLIGTPPWWQRAAGQVRLALRRACDGLPADERGLLPGLVDGDVAAEPEALKTDMRLTGLTHLTAVSGENVAVVLGVTLGVARAIGLRRRSRVALAALALLAFVILARPSPSVLRAAVMGSIVLLAMVAGRRIVATQTLAAAVTMLVVVNPFLARSVGFVLSVCATGAILLLAPRWTDRLAAYLPRPLAIMIAVPAAAQLACTPVLVLAFGQLTPYAVVANFFAAPAVVPATILGVACAATATVSTGIATALAWLAAAPTAVIAIVGHGFASLPGAGLRWPSGVGADIALVVALAIVAWVCVRRRRPSAQRDILGRWPV